MFENDRLKTGIRQLDDMLGGGLPRGEFMLIGGRPGMGKTSLLKQIMKTNEKTVCLYLSDDYCFDHLPLLIEALCQASNYDCYVVLDDLDQFETGEEEAGFRLKTVQYPADDRECGEVTTHFDFHDLSGSCLKVDILAHTVHDLIRRLEERTGVKAGDIPMDDPAVYSLFTSPDALGVTAEEIECNTGTLSLPEVSTPFVRQMLVSCNPQRFSDLIKISGLSHGTNVWLGNAQYLIEKGICSLKDVIAVRDDIMNHLIEKGLDKIEAFKIMEITRKGRANRMLSDEIINNLLVHGVPEWYIESLTKIRYMFPKAHAVAYMISAIRLGWYKLYYPKEYYKAYLSIYKVYSGEDDISEAILKEARCRGVDI